MNINELDSRIMRPDGAFADQILKDLDEVRARLNLSIEQVAIAAKISKGHLGNTTRFRGDKRLKVTPAFASRLAAVIDALKRAQSADDLRQALQPGDNTGASDADAMAPSAQLDDRANEDDGLNWSLEHALAILRRHGVSNIGLRHEEGNR
jgi:hypothetical protein